MKHLWEERHAYYCNEGNYYAPGNEQPGSVFDSFAEFLDEFGKSDIDYNLVFRWDWLPPDEDDEREHHELRVFFMGQRKGLYFWSIVKVTPEDESAVREWLNPRLAHLLKLWAPLLDDDAWSLPSAIAEHVRGKEG